MNKDILKFLKHLFVFLLFLGAVFYCINSIYISQFVLNNEKELKDNEILKSISNVKYLFLGDSRPATTIRPEFIPGSYNYCFGGENYSQVYYRARRVLRNDRMDYLVLPLDVHSFSDYRSNPYSDIIYWYKFLNVEELSRQTGKSEALLAINKHLPFIGNGRDFRGFSMYNNDGGNKMFVEGWRRLGDASRANDPNKEFEARNRVKEHFKRYPEIMNKELFDFFIKTIELAKDKNIKVILIKYPFSEDYLEEVAMLGIDVDKFYDDINEKIIKYDHVAILDYQTGFDDEFFYNSDHLNTGGAEIFSRQLDEDLKNLNLIN